MTNLDSILKSRNITLSTKVQSSQGYGFSSGHVWMWELDYKKSWAGKNWCFEVWCWRRLLRVPWTARRSNQSILKKSVLNVHWKDWCWSWNSSTLATWCKDLTHLKRRWYWERLRAGGEGDDRGWDGWMASLTQWTWVWVDSGSWWWTGRPAVLWFMGLQRVGHDWGTELNWTIVKIIRYWWKHKQIDQWNRGESLKRDPHRYHQLTFDKRFPGGSDDKETDCNAGYPDSVPRSGRSPGEGNGYPLQYSSLENSMDRGTWWAIVHGIEKSRHDWVTNTFNFLWQRSKDNTL